MSTETGTKALYSSLSSSKAKEYASDPLPQPLWFNLIVYVLQTKSSAEHPLTSDEIEEELLNIVPYDKSSRRLLDLIPTINDTKNIEDVYDTIAAVYGGRLVMVTGKPKKYYFEPFINPSDLNMIKGVILADKYLSNKEKDYLTSVEDLLCPIQAEKELTEASNLERPASIDKTTPYQVSNWFYSIQTIFEAIKNKKQLELIYGEYYFDSIKKTSRPKFQVKNTDNPYIVNPYALLWNNGHQYLITTTNEHENISHYRIDRIYSAKIHKIADEKGNFIPVKRKAVPPSLHSFYNRDDFNAEKYATTFPLMISASDNKRFLNNVVLECPTTALSTIIDHFGHDIKISTSNRTFTSNTYGNNQLISFCKIELKRVCYESILMFCLQQQASVFSPFPRIVALAPKELIDDIKLKLRDTLEYYESL
ncbi:MAG: WYL domain-containing protein [Catonella sp.]|uniref:WYL domain-containing protein n=1 Tax=Catonella sp. TaxID=2382125 RepID=UPI003FA03438